MIIKMIINDSDIQHHHYHSNTKATANNNGIIIMKINITLKELWVTSSLLFISVEAVLYTIGNHDHEFV